MHTLYVHITDGEAFVAEVNELPDPTHQFVNLTNPRKRDGKDLSYLMEEVNQIMLPWWRISYIEIMPTGEEEEVITFIRD
jgi:hypothetical protein